MWSHMLVGCFWICVCSCVCVCACARAPAYAAYTHICAGMQWWYPYPIITVVIRMITIHMCMSIYVWYIYIYIYIYAHTSKKDGVSVATWRAFVCWMELIASGVSSLQSARHLLLLVSLRGAIADQDDTCFVHDAIAGVRQARQKTKNKKNNVPSVKVLVIRHICSGSPEVPFPRHRY